MPRYKAVINKAKREAMIGKRFGEWTVMGYLGAFGGATRYDCLCSCGVRSNVAAQSLQHGKSKSCGHPRSEDGKRLGRPRKAG